MAKKGGGYCQNTNNLPKYPLRFARRTPPPPREIKNHAKLQEIREKLLNLVIFHQKELKIEVFCVKWPLFFGKILNYL